MTTRARASRPSRPDPAGASAWADPVDLLRWPKGTERIRAARLRTPPPPAPKDARRPPVAPLDPPEYRR